MRSFHLHDWSAPPTGSHTSPWWGRGTATGHTRHLQNLWTKRSRTGTVVCSRANAWGETWRRSCLFSERESRRRQIVSPGGGIFYAGDLLLHPLLWPVYAERAGPLTVSIKASLIVPTMNGSVGRPPGEFLAVRRRRDIKECSRWAVVAKRRRRPVPTNPSTCVS